MGSLGILFNHMSLLRAIYPRPDSRAFTLTLGRLPGVLVGAYGHLVDVVAYVSMLS